MAEKGLLGWPTRVGVVEELDPEGNVFEIKQGRDGVGS